MAKFQGMPMGRNLRVMEALALRTDTTARKVFNMPRGARIIGFILSGTASDAATTATLSIGSTTTATEYVNALDVKTAGTGSGVGLLRGVTAGIGAVLGGSVGQPGAADNYVYVKYAETGTASTVGAWKLFVLYTDGNYQYDPTI